MWPFPKKHFEWREPKAFRRALSEIDATWSQWWHKPLAGFGVACLLMAHWCLGKLNPDHNPPPFGLALALAFPTGLLLVTFVSWVNRVAPTCVMVGEKRIMRSNGSRHEEWKYEEIASFALENRGDYLVLVLGLCGGGRSPIGLPLEVNASALEGFLIGRGLARETA